MTHFNIILHLCLGLPSDLFLPGFSIRIPYSFCCLYLPYARPSHPCNLKHHHNIWEKVQATKLVVTKLMGQHLRPLSNRTLLAIQWQCDDDDTIHAW